MSDMKLWDKRWVHMVLAIYGNKLKRRVAWSSGKRTIELELYCRSVPVRKLYGLFNGDYLD